MTPFNRVTPDYIDTLESDEVFVFGSNLAGRHGAGAAKTARLSFRAEWGVGEGLTGQCYAIPTKDAHLRVISIEEIAKSVAAFAEICKKMTDHKFLVTEIGCGLAGYTPSQIAPLFNWAIGQDNVSLPSNFWYNLKTK